MSVQAEGNQVSNGEPQLKGFVGMEPDPDWLFEYVLDEICITVSAVGSIEPCSPEATQQRRAVAQLLNDGVPRYLPTPQTDEGGHEHFRTLTRRAVIPGDDEITADERRLLTDLGPTVSLWRQFRIGDDGLFRPVARWGAQSVFLPRCDCTTAHHYYRVALDPVNPAPSEARSPAYDQMRAQLIRELVNIVNFHFGRLPAGIDAGRQWQVIAATPHWFTTSAQEGGGIHGPGTPPELPDEVPPPLSPGQFGFVNNARPDDQALQKLVDEQRARAEECIPSGVIVAVLDQSPITEQVQWAYQKFKYNRLLQSLQNIHNPLHIDGSLSLMDADLAHMKGYVPFCRGNMAPWLDALYTTDLAVRAQKLKNLRNEFYPSEDHGVFVAGIIRDIAPGAELHLIRVLNDMGMGDLLAITDVLAAVPGLLRGDDESRPLVINLSLTFSVPTRREGIRRWFASLSAVGGMLDRLVNQSGGTELQRIQNAVNKVLADIQQSVDDVLAFLYRQNVVVVAAAGNDGQDEVKVQNRPDPSLPARAKTVISVTSVDLQMKASYFANRGELPGSENGVAVFSGDAVSDGKPQPSIIIETPALGQSRVKGSEEGSQAALDPHTDGTQGVFTAKKLPQISDPGNPPLDNKVGWVYWAGTSFSTPVISAIAANLLARNLQAGNPPMTVDQVISAVRQFATDPVPELGVNAIFAKQGE